MRSTADRGRAVGGRRLAALALPVWLIASLGGLASAPSLATPTTALRMGAAIRMHDIAFVPQSLTVSAGTTVTWSNDDDMAHTVTSGLDKDDEIWTSSPAIPPGGAFSVTFTKAGTYHYFCQPHRYSPAMHATIVVVPATR